MSDEDLSALPPVQGAFTGSKRKLTGYRDTLQAVYGDKLRLRVYSVVAVGYERLLWREMSA